MRRRVAQFVRVLAAAFVVLACVASDARAQDTTSTANLQPTPDGRITQIVLADGSSLYGRVLEVTATTVRFASSFGETTIARSSIALVRQVDPAAVHEGEIWSEDPSRTRLFFAPTGRMLRTGENYFTDAYVFFPSLQAGLSDQFSLGGGMSVFPGVGLLASPTVNVAVGALVAGAKVATNESPFGIGYGVATFGGQDAEVTAGAGFGFSRGGSSSAALLMVGGSTRVSRSIALVSENYLYTGSRGSALFSGGMRFMSEHIAVDIALLASSSSGATVVPYLAFIYRW